MRILLVSILLLKQLFPADSSCTVDTSLVVEGVVASDYRSENMALNPNVTYSFVDVKNNRRVAYLQDGDGSCAAKLIFDSAFDNELSRGDRISLNLKGSRVTHLSNPDRIEISSLGFRNVEMIEPGTVLAPKIKSISELSDNDLYSLVTIKDVEFVFKDGTYSDIYEGYAQPVEGYTYNDFYPNGRMDGWATLMRDVNGRSIYMLVNSRCAWRRKGSGVPKGVGTLTGVLVYEKLRRFGGNVGKYSLRPADISDIAIPSKGGSPWKLATGWEQDGSNGQSLTFETLGTIDELGKKGQKDDRILNDTGKSKGYLWTDSGSTIYVGGDLNSLVPDDRGVQKNGSILFSGKTSQWFVFDSNGNVMGTRSFFIEFNASKLKGTDMTLSFSWLAGSPDVNYCYNFPAVWKIQMSLDNGRSWHDLRETATGAKAIILRSHPWYDKAPKYASGKKQTGYDCGLGMQQRSFAIPATAFGQQSVVLRITPATPDLAAIRSNPTKSMLDPSAKPTANMKNVTQIRFGKILIEYK